MPSLGEALAAVIAEVNRGEVDASTQYVTYPGFFFPVTPDALATDGRPAAFDFIHRVNMVPGKPPLFTMKASFVWRIYKQILGERRLAPDEGAAKGYAKRFLDAEAEMGLGLLSPQENSYFATNVTPSDIEAPASWSTVSMDASTIGSLAATVGPADRILLDRFNTLASLGEDFIDSVSFERATLVVLRPWFDPAVFTWRFWDLPGVTLSDGLDPPEGQLPGVVSKLILVRNLKVRLAATALPDVGPTVVYRTVEGAPPPPPPATDQLVAVGQAAAEPAIIAKPLRRDGGEVEQQIASLQEEAALEIGLTADGKPRGAQRFHVPITFDTSAARELAKAELTKAEQERSGPTIGHFHATAVHLDAVMAEAPPARRVGRFGRMAGVAGVFARPRKPAVVVAEPWQPSGGGGNAESERRIKRWRDALSVLDRLAAEAPDPKAYVASLVIDRTPKSPDPDETLFH